MSISSRAIAGLAILCVVVFNLIIGSNVSQALRFYFGVQTTTRLIRSSSDHQHDEEESTCGVYIAESSIPNAGMGVYSGANVSRNSGIEPADIMIPVGYNSYHESGVMINDYTWDDESYGGLKTVIKYEGKRSSSIVPGFGALPNHFALSNIHYQGRAKDSQSGPRVDYGALTPFHNERIFSSQNIDAGSELFLDYGSGYFHARESIYGKIPQKQHYRIAAKLIVDFQQLIGEGNTNLMATDLAEKLWTLLRENAVPNISRVLPQNIIEHAPSKTTITRVDEYIDKIVQEFLQLVNGTISDPQEVKQRLWNLFGYVADPYVTAALPKDFQELEAVRSNGGLIEYMKRRHTRSTSWLSENGLCVDYLLVGGSTVLEAGRGAFSRVFLHKGSLITPCPLIQMHQSVLESKLRLSTGAQYIYEKLLMNYCFGHPKSSVKFCPYGSASHLINHSSDKANAKIQWSESPLMNSSRLEAPVEELLGLEYPARILFDIVATRDILPHEEIFINYGQAWEDSWNTQKSEWNDFYGWPEKNKNDEIIPDTQQLQLDQLLSESNAAKTACLYNFYAPTVPIALETKQNLRHTTRGNQRTLFPSIDNYPNESLSASLGYYYDWTYISNNTHTLGGLYPCKISSQETNSEEENETWFTAQIDPLADMEGIKPRMVHHIPRKAIVLVNQRWLSEVHGETREEGEYEALLPFRHYIVIPDEVFPTSWMDLDMVRRPN